MGRLWSYGNFNISTTGTCNGDLTVSMLGRERLSQYRLIPRSVIYPLVISQLAIENCHLWLTSPVKMMIFYSYISLPESNFNNYVQLPTIESLNLNMLNHLPRYDSFTNPRYNMFSQYHQLLNAYILSYVWPRSYVIFGISLHRYVPNILVTFPW